MKFFVPHAETKEKEETLYEGIKQFAKETLGWKVTDRRIFSIRYVHNGKEYYAEVGKTETAVHEEVFAILESNAYLICTTNRGVFRGMPLLVGESDTYSVVDFEL